MPPILSDAALRACCAALTPGMTDAVIRRIAVLPSRTPRRLDLSTDAALLASHAAGLDAPAFASRLADSLARLPGVGEVRVEGPGFLNIRVRDDALDGILPEILSQPLAGPEPAPLTLPLAAMHLGDAAFGIQHAHARCRSVLRAAALMPGLDISDPAALGQAARGAFASGAARVLLCRLDHWPRLGEAPASGRTPARIALFLRDLSDQFDRLWKASRDDATLRFLYPDKPARSLANLALVLATAETIRAGLAVLGQGAAEELR